MFRGRRFHEWVQAFEAKAGERFLLPPGFKMWTGPDNSFITYKIDGDTFLIGQAIGDGERWRHFAYAIAREHGCKYIKTQTLRSPRAFCRKWGAKVTDTQDLNGKPCYTLLVEV
jgi:hypothetical protein